MNKVRGIICQDKKTKVSEESVSPKKLDLVCAFSLMSGIPKSESEFRGPRELLL